MELLAYVFVCFSIGMTCLGVLVLWARRASDPIARIFLAFYFALSVMVMAALLRGLLEVLGPPVSARLRFGAEYLEAMVGLYGVLLTLPLLVHRLFGVVSRRREMGLVALVVAAAGLQHLTEYGLGSVWDERGDVAENIFAAGLLAYVAAVALSRLGHVGSHLVLARRVCWLFLASTPGLAYDLFWADDGPWRFYPLLYCIFSLLATWTLVEQRPAETPTRIPRVWGLSARESEVAELVLRGWSNREIAEQLRISPNTVKTHLRSVFGKSGVHSRFELMSACRPPVLLDPKTG